MPEKSARRHAASAVWGTLMLMAKAAPKRHPSQGARVCEAELRELRGIEARVMAGTEPIVEGEIVMLQTMRSLVKAAKRKRA